MNVSFDMSTLNTWRRLVDEAPRRARATAAIAITRTLQHTKEALRAEMRDSLDKPTPYTLNSLYLKRADRYAAQVAGEVGIKDDFTTRSPVKWLQYQVAGGTRRPKAFEKLLQRNGAMQSDMVSVPAQGARLDAHGNMSRGQIGQILSHLRIDSFAGHSRSMARVLPSDNAPTARDKRHRIRRARGRAGGEYVAFPRGRGKLKPGIYKATGRDFGARIGYGRTGKLEPVLIFVRRASYEAGRFDFYTAARLSVQRHAPAEMAAALRGTLALMQTARA